MRDSIAQPRTPMREKKNEIQTIRPTGRYRQQHGLWADLHCPASILIALHCAALHESPSGEPPPNCTLTAITSMKWKGGKRNTRAICIWLAWFCRFDFGTGSKYANGNGGSRSLAHGVFASTWLGFSWRMGVLACGGACVTYHQQT